MWDNTRETYVTATAVQQYHSRMQRVLDYIDGHLDDDLDVAVLSGVAAFSKHHFHRQFSELFGISVYRYVQLARLKRASYRLAFCQDNSVFDIALDSGYAAPEAFARSFKKRIGQSPSAFRKLPQWFSWHEAYGPFHAARSRQTMTFSDDQVTLTDFPATPVAVLEHRGDPALIGDSIRRFIAWRKQAGLPPKLSATFNILYNDPETTAPEDYRLDICAATAKPLAGNDAGIISGVIAGGRCAVLRLTGSSDNLRPAISWLYRDWLPRNGHDTRDAPLFVQRVVFFPEAPENAAVTDIFLPLQ